MVFRVILPPLHGEIKHKLLITSGMEIPNIHFSTKKVTYAHPGAFVLMHCKNDLFGLVYLHFILQNVLMIMTLHLVIGMHL